MQSLLIVSCHADKNYINTSKIPANKWKPEIDIGA